VGLVRGRCGLVRYKGSRSGRAEEDGYRAKAGLGQCETRDNNTHIYPLSGRQRPLVVLVEHTSYCTTGHDFRFRRL